MSRKVKLRPWNMNRNVSYKSECMYNAIFSRKMAFFKMRKKNVYFYDQAFLITEDIGKWTSVEYRKISKLTSVISKFVWDFSCLTRGGSDVVLNHIGLTTIIFTFFPKISAYFRDFTVTRYFIRLTSITIDWICLTMVLGYFMMDLAHNVGTNWSLEDGWQAYWSLSWFILFRINGDERTRGWQRLKIKISC